jgi:hypothetical protein
MILEFSQGLNPKQVVEATKLIVKDNYGRPILVVLQYDNQTIAVHKAEVGDNSKFNSVLRSINEPGLGTVKEITI